MKAKSKRAIKEELVTLGEALIALASVMPDSTTERESKIAKREEAADVREREQDLREKHLNELARQVGIAQVAKTTKRLAARSVEDL